jgi:hypothetical protein
MRTVLERDVGPAEGVGVGTKPRAPRMVASDWRAVERNKGFFNLKLRSRFKFNDCSLHEQGGRRWVGLPGKPQLDETGKHRTDPTTGKKLYTSIIQLNRERRERFQAEALAAVDVILDGVP